MKKFGLLGEKLSHSFSEEIHNLFLKEKNIQGNYQLLEKNQGEIEEVLKMIKTGEYDGVNVTVPYKVEIMKYLDVISEEAKEIGAVNTVVCVNNELRGYNTDYFGFLKTLEINNINIMGVKILILGTGGAAKSVYNVLVKGGADKIFLATLRENNTFKRRKGDRIIHYAEISNIKNVDLVVNCTPVGMYPDIDGCPLSNEQLIESKYFIDLIYNPKETVLMKKYKVRGTKVINGFWMLIMQAIKAQEIWNNQIFDEEIGKIIYEKLKTKLYD